MDIRPATLPNKHIHYQVPKAKGELCMYDRQQGQGYQMYPGYPGFPGQPGQPGQPGYYPGNIEQQLREIERQLRRQDRRITRIERQIGIRDEDYGN